MARACVQDDVNCPLRTESMEPSASQSGRTLQHAPSQCMLLMRCRKQLPLQADEVPRLPRISWIEALYRFMWRRKVGVVCGVSGM